MHVVATFDLNNANDYEKAYEALRKLGLSRTIQTAKGTANMPSTTVAKDVGNTDPDTLAWYNAIVECLKGAGFVASCLFVMAVPKFALTSPN